MKFIKVPLDNLLTETTKDSFDGPCSYFFLLPNVEYGPFYRVGCKKLSSDTISKLPSGKLRPNINYLKQPRVGRLSSFLEKELDVDTNKKLIGAFLVNHSEEIEMDPTFSLLPAFQLLLPDTWKSKIADLWYGISPGRWCGIEQPSDFWGASKKYHLDHLVLKVLHEGIKVFLFEFYFHYKGSSRSEAELFFGRAKGGTALQFKFNNIAAESIVKLRALKDFTGDILESVKKEPALLSSSQEGL